MNANDIFNEVMTRKSGQRGKKRCPDCDKLVGVRTFKCDCGYQFVNKKTQREIRNEEDLPTDEEKLYAMSIGSPGGRIVYTASGSPPARLDEITYETVKDYCNLIVHDGVQNDRIYTSSAIKGYLGHQFGYNSNEYVEACKFVDQWYDEKLGVDTPTGVEYVEN